MSAVFVPWIGDIVEVQNEEYHHLTRSLRVRVGEKVWLTNGKGTLALGEVQRITRSLAEIVVIQRFEKPGEPPAPITLLVSPLRQPARIDWLIEKAVELGVTTVYLLPMERSVRKHVDIARLERVAIAALKQNLRSVLPAIHFLSSWEAVPWEEFACRLMGEIGAPVALGEALPSQPSPTLWIVGPEGDFTTQEVEALRERGVQGVSLGHLRLRAETAAILFLSALKVRWSY
ncbi:MAG: 16S rRNA (uracil(1498)-N(3))-methyltransferase [Bacteroidia bacterium]|nr:16S rRNA (uracil(1498)-N(3))-methyltransferase [Bacteroidia bacterium]